MTPRQEKLVRTLLYMKSAGDPIPEEAWELIDELALIADNGWGVTLAPPVPERETANDMAEDLADEVEVEEVEMDNEADAAIEETKAAE